MRVLISTKEFFPARGGLQASVDKLARRLATRGQYCAVLTQIPLREKRQPRILAARTVKKLFNRPVVINDKTFSYPVYRIQNPSEGLPIVIKSFKPDLTPFHLQGSFLNLLVIFPL
jgi:hypothetical protein